MDTVHSCKTEWHNDGTYCCSTGCAVRDCGSWQLQLKPRRTSEVHKAVPAECSCAWGLADCSVLPTCTLAGCSS